MSMLMSTTTAAQREEALKAATLAIGKGKLVLIPTDTVYGVAADAFEPDAVRKLLSAKGRDRTMPPPVLIGRPETLDALTTDLPDYARVLVEAFWPGPLTIVARQQGALKWDLGDTRGTVAVRVPDHDVARDLLDRTGPLAVSSANMSGKPPTTTAEEAQDMIGEATIVLDAGPTPGPTASTIVDVTGASPRLLRAGVVAIADLDGALAGLGVTVAQEV
jgi:L-threonylcarbamoyladenylate synthase